MTLWSIAFILSTALGAAGFVVVAVLWLRKLRESLGGALAEAARHQMRTTQRLSETIASLQRQQQATEQRLEILAQANLRLKSELDQLAGRVETTDPTTTSTPPHRILH